MQNTENLENIIHCSFSPFDHEMFEELNKGEQLEKLSNINYEKVFEIINEFEFMNLDLLLIKILMKLKSKGVFLEEKEELDCLLYQLGISMFINPEFNLEQHLDEFIAETF